MTQVLRLTQNPSSQGKYNVRIELQKGGFAQTADVSFEFHLSIQTQELLRWYFEDYLQYPEDPAPTIADKAEQDLTNIGIKLFDKIFKSNFDAQKIWSNALDKLNDTRIEIVTDVQEAMAIPWELICNPDTFQPLALSAASFMRTFTEAAVPPINQTSQGTIRILLAICRPSGDDDVPFRSVASRVITGLSKEDGTRFQLDLLRPPTFDQLGRVLRRAKAEGKPYHVFHFDGHGTYADLSRSADYCKMSRITLAANRTGPCGYLLFENPRRDENMEFVDGTNLGNLLRENEVHILVLNACRSAYAESPNEPASAQDDKQMDAHKRVRAFGSLAQEVMHSGLSGVVAMRYVVYVVTAAQFVAELYDALVRGMTLEEAVNLGRKHLHDQPQREIFFRERELQDWSVPVVFGVGSLALFPRQEVEKKFEINICESETIPDQVYLDSSLPPRPDTGFFGRDGILQAIDRAFDEHKLVLLHAYAGNGKTDTAVEFSRWYSLTGGLKGSDGFNGYVLFTSFERYMPLSRVLDKIGRVFGRILTAQGIQWLTLDDYNRYNVALQLLKHYQVLWIWDNIEPVAGFPIGSESAWSTKEQNDLVNFLRATRDTKAKFLLTSRRDERDLLGNLPYRIIVPPMPMFERIELARAIANKRWNTMVDVESLKPLLRYTEGNPLTIIVLMGQALRERLNTKDQIKQLVDQLRAGEKDIEDDENQGRTKSLGASLRYGSQTAFNEKERHILAVLSLFQGFVDVDVLRQMGQSSLLQENLRDIDRETGIRILDKAVEVGMLMALGNGYYRIHPALPWFFRGLFQQYYKYYEDDAVRAFAESVGSMGNYYWGQHEAGHPEVISILAAEEDNLVHSRQLAIKKGWWDAAINSMQGLYKLYIQTGRWVEWRRLVDETLPFFLNYGTDGPIPGREKQWNVITDYRVKIAIMSRQWDEAMRLQKMQVELQLEKAGPNLDVDPNEIDEVIRNIIRNYIVAIGDLAWIQMGISDVACIKSYKEAIEKSERYGFLPDVAAYSLNLGNVYLIIPEFRDLDQAEHLLRRALDLTSKSNVLMLGQCLASLGHVAQQRFLDAQKAGKPEAKYLNFAEEFYLHALEVHPTTAVNERATSHNSLGNVYRYAGMFDKAEKQFRIAIRYADSLGNHYRSATYRLNAAYNFFYAGQLDIALKYALSARAKFEACGPTTIKEVFETQNLIFDLDEAAKPELNQSL